MKMPKELINAFLIFIGISIYFLLLEFFGFSIHLYLRLLNAAFIYFGVNRTLRLNMEEGQFGYITNLLSAGTTALVAVFLCVGGMIAYIYMRGGTAYIHNLSGELLFGGKPTVNEYCLGVLFEGIASSVIIVFVAMQLWRKKTSSQED